jgi:hypothetical protein
MEGRGVMTRLSVLVALSCYFWVPTPARADPITITGGTLTSVGIFGPVSFTLTGDGFSVMGGNEPGSAGPSGCSPCVPGDVVSFQGHFAGEFTLGSGPATVNAVSYPKLYYAGVLEFEAGGKTFPGGSSMVELVSPFMLSDASFLQGFLTSDLHVPEVFRFDLNGRGLATATFREGPSGGFDFQQVTYAFLASPTAVPEPTSVLLLATGLIGAGVRQWRRRKTYP